MLQFQVKSFNNLTNTQLYELLQLRTEVFIVEQNCVYQDTDNKDSKALHVLGYYENELVAYARLFAPTLYFEEASIGRVIVRKSHRALKLGHELMEFCIHEIENQFHVKTIKIGAQKYLVRFYNAHNFNEVGDEYLEDEILHVHMIRE
jgi:ElaA protein